MNAYTEQADLQVTPTHPPLTHTHNFTHTFEHLENLFRDCHTEVDIHLTF